MPITDLQPHKTISNATRKKYSKPSVEYTLDVSGCPRRIPNSEIQNFKILPRTVKMQPKRLQNEVQYVTKVQAKGDVLESLRKAFRTSRHHKALQAVEQSLSRYHQLIKTELASHLCSQSDAIYLQQEHSFHKLDRDVQSLVNQLAQGFTELTDHVKNEHATTRAVLTQQATRAERAIQAHTYLQVLDLKTTTETDQRCRTFLESLKAERMNQRYTDVLDPKNASFRQVFATYKEVRAMGYQDTEDEEYLDNVWSSWYSFTSWLQSENMLYYIEGKPGSGKSTLVKFIVDHERTRDLIQQWSPNVIVIRHFFWKIGSHEQNSIKGLLCSLLYQRLQGRLSLVPNLLQHFPHLSLHTCYHDWTIKDLQAVWEYTFNFDDRHICIFIDGLDEIRNEDGFSGVIQSVQLLLKFPQTKLCVSTRPEARIMRWIKEAGACGLRLEDLTKHDMMVFVRNKLSSLLPYQPDLFKILRQDLVKKAQGVFLWIHLAIKSLIEGIENDDPENMLLRRLDELPEDLESLYMDMWQRLNANNSVYRQTAARYFRYVLLGSLSRFGFEWNEDSHVARLPFNFQIACAENHEMQTRVLRGGSIFDTVEVLQMCEATKASIRTRCAGLLEFQPPKDFGPTADHNIAVNNAFGAVAFIHRTAHDFLVDTEAGRKILGHDCSTEFSLQCGLLKGLICSVIVSSQWGLAWELHLVIHEITRLGKCWGSSNLEVAFEVLDVVRPLYDNAYIKVAGALDNYRQPFFSYLTYNDWFDDFVIPRLVATNSLQIANDTLREGWSPACYEILSKRVFEVLLSLGADPHKRGVSSSSMMSGPFVSKTTAFTHLLVAFFLSRENPFKKAFNTSFTCGGCPSLCLQDSNDIIQMATHMARSCEYLNAGIILTGRFFEGQTMGMESLRILPTFLLRPDIYGTHFVIYEISLQFLLAYLLSRAGGDSAERILKTFGAQDLLPKVNNPWIKMRYFLLRKAGKSTPQNPVPVTCHRVAPHASYLPKHLIEHLLSPKQRSLPNHSFKIHLKRQSEGTFVLYDTGADLGTVTHGIKDSEIEEVDYETMMTGLAHDSPDISTYEEAGIIPSAVYLRRQRELDNPKWCWLPFMMGRLEAAAASREERGDEEDLN